MITHLSGNCVPAQFGIRPDRYTLEGLRAARSLRRRLLIAATSLALLPTASLAAVEFWERGGEIVAEAEEASRLTASEIIFRQDASGGRAVRWQDEKGRAEFDLRVFTPGTWHVWIRTQAADHLNNGLFLELNGVRQKAPASHPMAGTEVIYLRKHATAYAWKPEWQGPGEGNHAGPITIEIDRAGVHRLAVTVRRSERPLVDKIVLTRNPAPPFLTASASLGPWPTRREPIPGQLLVHPQNGLRLARFQPDRGGRLEEVMLCGLGSPEGFLFLPEAQQDEIISLLQRHGGNMLYLMAVRSHGGDGTPQENPFRNHNPADGLDSAVFDRWERILRRLADATIAAFFLVYDDNAAPFGHRKQDTIPAAEAEFFAQLVRRFAHLPNLIWGVAEEYRDALTPARAAGLAAIMARENRAGLPLSIHHATGQTNFDFAGHSWVDVFSQQPNGNSPEALYAQVRKAVDESGGRWLVHMAENWNERKGDHAACVIAGDRAGVRLRNWATLMAGAAVCQVIGPWEVSAHGKPATPEMLSDMRTLNGFFSALPLSQLKPCDETAAGDAAWALASGDRMAAVLHATSGSGEIVARNMRPGTLALHWIDPATGAKVVRHRTHSGGDVRLARPAGIGAECALAIVVTP